MSRGGGHQRRVNRSSGGPFFSLTQTVAFLLLRPLQRLAGEEVHWNDNHAQTTAHVCDFLAYRLS